MSMRMSDRPAKPALALVVIRSNDLDRSHRFYRQLGLEFVRHRHGKGPEHFSCELGSGVFEIYPRASETDATSSTRLGFHVASVDEMLTKLQASDVTVVAPACDSPWGRRAVVQDPDGHKVELTENRPGATAGTEV
jgi:catechol 2,3-dioxygenase-like lactoylglutathione lyase family enzyme